MSDIFIPGSIKPEADYLELERLSTKLGIPVPMMHITLEARDKDGNVTYRYHDRSRTWNRNFWNKVFAINAASNLNHASLSNDTTFGAGHLAAKNTAGTVLSPSASTFLSAASDFANAAIGVVTGIVVGTGTGAESFEGYVLGTPIVHGTSATQMSYTAMTYAQPSYNSGTKVWTSQQSRIFNNNSGGTIVVAETALYDGNVSPAAMFERSLLGSTVSVLNAGQLTVTYTITLTFPA